MNQSSTDAPLMLSVSGARGIVGRSMTPPVAAQFARAFGSILREQDDSHAPALSDGGKPRLILARDSRPTGADLARAAAESLAGAGFDVVDLGVAMTPTAGVMISQINAAGGIVVTASHNPIEWNGLKCLVAPGVAPPADLAARIIARFQHADAEDGSTAAAEPGTITTDESATAQHVARVLDAVAPGPIRSRRFRIVLDSINGAGCAGGRALLEQLGCEVIHLNGEPTGEFAHTPEPTKENLTSLCDAVREHAADLGFAQDPDADRLAIVDERGEYIGEEYTLVLAAKYVLDRDGGGVLAANLSTSRMIDDLAAKYPGSSVLRTAVGEANVAAALMGAGGGGQRSAVSGQRSARSQEPTANLLRLGGEGNGGVIYPPVTWVRDSLSAMALVLGLLAAEDRPLSRVAADVGGYVMIKRNFDLAEMGGRDAIPGLLEKVKRQFANERVDTADGVRIDFEDGWVHLRPSNTEPIVRLIAEGEDEEAVERLLGRVRLTH